MRELIPQWGRYLEEDPLGLAADENIRAYVSNRPVSGSDPTGMEDRVISFENKKIFQQGFHLAGASDEFSDYMSDICNDDINYFTEHPYMTGEDRATLGGELGAMLDGQADAWMMKQVMDTPLAQRLEQYGNDTLQSVGSDVRRRLESLPSLTGPLSHALDPNNY